MKSPNVKRRLITIWGLVLLLACSNVAFAGEKRDDTPRWDAIRTGEVIAAPPLSRSAHFDDQIRPALPGEPVPTDPRDGTIAERNPGTDLTALPSGALEIVNGYEESGGDDVIFGNCDYLGRTHIAITESGVIFFALGITNRDTWDEFIEIYRSLDGGESFTRIHTISSSGSDSDRLSGLAVVEGNADRLFVNYSHWNNSRGAFEMRIAWVDIATPTTGWQIRTPMDMPGVSILQPHLTDDSTAFSAYYLYAVAGGLDGNGDDIWFTYSTNFGDTWSTPFRVATLSSSGNLMYSGPKIAFGSGGELHLTYVYTERLQNTFDDSLRARRATSYGVNVASWPATGVWDLGTTVGGAYQYNIDLVTDAATDKVFTVFSEGGTGTRYIWESLNGGETWANADLRVIPMGGIRDAVVDHTNGRLVLAGYVSGGAGVFSRAAWIEASVNDLSVWSDPKYFNNQTTSWTPSPRIALDPSRPSELAMAFTASTGDPSDHAAFDATWRDGPGIPNYEDGFPIALSASPAGPPTIANLDGDAFGEITWLDNDGMLHHVSHTGVEVGGWPENIGNPVNGTAVAVGDLNGDGSPALVVGDAIGQLHARHSTSTLSLSGFPVSLGTEPVRAAVAPVAAPYPMSIVATCGQKVFLVNYRGAILQTWDLGKDINTAPSIGDLDGDGAAEIVVTTDQHLVRLSPGDPSPDFTTLVTLSGLSSPATLVDTDLDGIREIALGTDDGYLKLFDASGALLWNYYMGISTKVNAVAAANILGTFEPELIATCWNSVHVVYADGTVHANYPQNSSAGNAGYGIITAPVANTVHWSSSDVIAGNGNGKAWAWANIGGYPAGWPKDLESYLKFAAATGDIDNDGSNEIVYLTNETLVMLDVAIAPHLTPSRRWAQWGSDAGHSFAHAASGAPVVSGVEDTRTVFAFAPPSPNPSSGSTNFSFAMPADGRAELVVFDLRGRRLRKVLARQFGLGTHTVQFDGRDEQGHRLANGVYFARLNITGGGRQYSETRKIVVMR